MRHTKRRTFLFRRFGTDDTEEEVSGKHSVVHGLLAIMIATGYSMPPMRKSAQLQCQLPTKRPGDNEIEVAHIRENVNNGQ